MRRRSFLALAASLPLLSIARPTAAQTPVADADDTGLLALLGLLPEDALADTAWVQYADYELQLAAMGVEDGRGRENVDTWIDAVRELGVPSAMERALFDAIWRDSLGFDPRDIDALLESRSVSGSVTIMRGGFDALDPAWWTRMGYEPVEADGATWYTIGDVNLLEADHMIHRLHLGYLRHLVMLDERTVVGTADTADMERVLALHAGGTGSLADGRGAALASVPAGLVGATIVDGAELVPDLDPELVARLPVAEGMSEAQVAAHVARVREEAARMPPIDLVLLGLTGGRMRGEELGPAARSRAVAVIVPGDPVDAELVAETIARRLTTETVPESALIGERSWVEAFPGMDIDTAPGGASVVVKLTPADDVPSNRLIHLLRLNELSILNWSG